MKPLFVVPPVNAVHLSYIITKELEGTCLSSDIILLVKGIDRCKDELASTSETLFNKGFTYQQQSVCTASFGNSHPEQE